jgi:hypothetical protein
MYTRQRWFIDYDWGRLCLRTATTNVPIVHPPGWLWAWRAMMMMMLPAGANTWLVHQSSLAFIRAETHVASRRNGRRSENFACQYFKYLKGYLTYSKILRHGTSGFTSHPKEDVLRIFIALKIPSPGPGLNPRLLGPVASTLTTTPPRRAKRRYLWCVAAVVTTHNTTSGPPESDVWPIFNYEIRPSRKINKLLVPFVAAWSEHNATHCTFAHALQAVTDTSWSSVISFVQF